MKELGLPALLSLLIFFLNNFLSYNLDNFFSRNERKFFSNKFYQKNYLIFQLANSYIYFIHTIIYTTSFNFTLRTQLFYTLLAETI